MVHQKAVTVFILAFTLILIFQSGGFRLIMPIQADTAVHDGDFVLDGNQLLTIRDSQYIQNGSITIRDSAKLILENVTLHIGMPYNITVTDNASLFLNDSTIESSTSSIYVSKMANLSLLNADLDTGYLSVCGNSTLDATGCPWIGTTFMYNSSKLMFENTTFNAAVFNDNSSGTIVDSTLNRHGIGLLRLNGDSSVIVQNSTLSHIPYLDLVIQDNASLQIMNSTVAEGEFYDFSNAKIQHTTITERLACYGYSSTVVIDSPNLGFIEALDNSSVTVKNSIAPALYAAGSAALHVINSQIGQRQLTMDEHSKLYYDYPLTVKLNLNGSGLENANVSIYLLPDQREVTTAETNTEGEADFILSGEVVTQYLNTTEHFDYLVEVLYGPYSMNSTVTPGTDKNVTIDLAHIILPQSSEPLWYPESPSTDEDVLVEIPTKDMQLPLSGATLWYAANDTWQSLGMTFYGTSWTARIPKEGAETVVKFYVEAESPIGLRIHTYTYNYTVETTAAPVWQQWWVWTIIVAAGTIVTVALALKKRMKHSLNQSRKPETEDKKNLSTVQTSDHD